MRIEAVAEMLGGRRVLKRSVHTDLELAEAVRAGLPAVVLHHLIAAVENVGTLRMYKLVGSPRTLQRKVTARATLSPDESDRAARVARVVTRAEEALGNRAKAHRWLQRPNRALGGGVPLELLDSDAGAQAVARVLGRIEHGIVG